MIKWASLAFDKIHAIYTTSELSHFASIIFLTLGANNSF